MNLLTWYILLFVLAVVNFFYGVSKLKSFRSEHTSIRYIGDLESFKSLVRGQMYIALLQILILGAALVLGIYGILKNELSLMVVLVMNGIIFFLGKSCKKIEEDIRSMPVEDERFQVEFKKISRTWLHKPLPDF